jgi:hypothetical protein
MDDDLLQEQLAILDESLHQLVEVSENLQTLEGVPTERAEPLLASIKARIIHIRKLRASLAREVYGRR